MSTFKHNKNLGIDRIGTKILKLFWPDLKHYYLEVLNEVYNTRSLTKCQSNGILSVIDKQNDLSKIKNWVPLRNLCMDYNPLTKIQTIRNSIPSKDYRCRSKKVHEGSLY